MSMRQHLHCADRGPLAATATAPSARAPQGVVYPPSAHDEFMAGSTYTDSVSVTSADGTVSSITVNIPGT
ncbi:MAG: hypothetical protein IPJ25_08620 [Rhodocyclaceae bacterium]|nr:hypothetical protein [Rhodocyclaceae bacterium]